MFEKYECIDSKKIISKYDNFNIETIKKARDIVMNDKYENKFINVPFFVVVNENDILYVYNLRFRISTKLKKDIILNILDKSIFEKLSYLILLYMKSMGIDINSYITIKVIISKSKNSYDDTATTNRFIYNFDNNKLIFVFKNTPIEIKVSLHKDSVSEIVNSFIDTQRILNYHIDKK